MLVNERKNAEAAKSADLIQRVSSSLLGEFMQKRDESLRGSVESLQNSNVEAKALLILTFGRQVDIHQDAMQRNSDLPVEFRVGTRHLRKLPIVQVHRSSESSLALGFILYYLIHLFKTYHDAIPSCHIFYAPIS